MPYENEHSARLKSPGDFDPKTFRRTAGGTIYGSIKVPASIGIIWGKLKGSAKPSDMPIPQSLRFAKDKWTVAQAKKWLKDNNVKYQSFEPAKEERSIMTDEQTPKMERRSIDFEVRAETEGDKPIIEGTAAIFNKRAMIRPGVYEEIKTGAFDEALKASDVRALFNHNPSLILGRQSAGTLELRVDRKGMHYKILPPDTQMAKDVIISIKRGDITGSSFSFDVAVDGAEFRMIKDGVLRTVNVFAEIGDVGPVTYPVWEETKSAARSRDAFLEEQEQPPEDPPESQQEEEWETEARERELELAEANG